MDTANVVNRLLIGWASRDVTPSGKVSLRGQFYMRVTEEVRDPLTTTALALSSADGKTQSVIVSLDAVYVSDYVRDGCRARLKQTLRELDPDSLVISATHTHTAPEQPGRLLGQRPDLGPDSGILSAEAYGDILIDRISDAVREAWENRKPGALSWGRAQTVIGFNRRTAYADGSTRMYGPTDVPDFSHMEGHEDHAVELLFAYDADRALTGMVVNVPCPSQCSEHQYAVSADYWHDTRRAIRARHGDNVHILGQCSAAGDLSPRAMLNRDADARMLRLKGYGETYDDARRRDIADKLAAAVDEVLPLASQEIHDSVVLASRRMNLELDRRRATEEDLHEAERQVAAAQAALDGLDASDPTSKAYSGMLCRRGYYQNVIDIYHAQQRGELLTLPVELHVLRIGDVAVCTNRFEFYLDFGDRIKGRSKALQTFVAQLAGSGSYLPAERSVCGGSYGAIIASTPIGPEGGQQVVDATVRAIEEIFAEDADTRGQHASASEPSVPASPDAL